MKKRLTQLSICILSIFLLPGSILSQVKIAVDPLLTTPADPSAILDVVSDEKGFLPPRMTKVQRDGIAAPAKGLTVFNTTEDCINIFDGTAWETYCELRYSTVCNCVEYLNDYGLPTEAWIPIAPPPSNDHDWYEQGTTSAPTAITSNIFTQGNIGIGVPAPLQSVHTSGYVRSDGRRYYFGATQRLLGDNASALYYDGAHATIVQMLFRDSGANQHGRIYGSGGGVNFGLRDQANQWIFFSRLNSYLTFGVAGGEKVRVMSSGNVGIGTTAPTQLLDVNGGARIRTLPAGAVADQVVVADANGVLRKLPASGLGLNDHDWYAVGTTAAPTSINDDVFTQGNTGIGIAAPLEQLHVAGAIRTDARRVYFGANQNLFGNNADRLQYTSNSATLSKILHFNNAGLFYGGMVGHNDGSFGMNDRDDHWTFRALHDQFLTMSIDNSEKVRVLLNGNVGIGTNAPTQRLDVNGGARIRTLPAGLTTDQVVVAHANGTLRKLPISGLGLEDHDWYAVGTTAAPTSINDDVFTQGNTGIGVTAPAQQLHVAGAMRTDARRVYFGAAQELYGNNTDRLEYTSNSATLAKILHFNSAGVFYGGMVGHNDGSFGMNDRDNHWTFRGVHDQYLTMSINNSEKVRVLLNGNVGIGINAPTQRLDVNGGARIRTLPAGLTTDQVVVAHANGTLRKLPISTLAADDHDWYAVGTTAAPTSINDNIFTQGNTGIGITAPTAGLHLVSNNGMIATGTLNGGLQMPAGAATKMVWSPRNAAFRAGRVTGTQWDEANTGLYSAAFGINTRASGSHTLAVGNTTTASAPYSVVTGNNSTASGNVSFATGNNVTASGNYSVAAGNGSTASGSTSFAYGTNAQATSTNTLAIGNAATATSGNSISIGFQTVASGPSSLAMGFQAEATGTGSKAIGGQSISTGFNAVSIGEGTLARSRSEIVLGSFNDDYTPNSPTGWNDYDRILAIGNGPDAANRDNILTMSKGGHSGFGGTIYARKPATYYANLPALRIRNENNLNYVARFEQTSASNVSDAVSISNVGTGDGIDIMMTNNNSLGTAVEVIHQGRGDGVQVQLLNAANARDGVSGYILGTGVGVLGGADGVGAGGAGVVGTNKFANNGWRYIESSLGGHGGTQGLTEGGVAGIEGYVWRNASTNLRNVQAGYFANLYGPVNGSLPLTLSFARVAYIDAGGTPRKIDGTGVAGTIVKDLKDKPVLMSSMETPEILFSDYGHGELVNGKATIKLDPIFSKNIVVDEKNRMKVFVQLEGDCKGVFVTNKTAQGFEVQELQGGKSTVSFTYMVTANRANDEINGNKVTYDSSKRFAPGPSPNEIKAVKSSSPELPQDGEQDELLEEGGQ